MRKSENAMDLIGPGPPGGMWRYGRLFSVGAVRALPLRYKKSCRQTLTVDGLLDLLFGLLGFGLTKPIKPFDAV
jgi:hypothetical protein